MRFSEYKVDLEFTELLLGACQKSESLYRDFIASKSPIPEDAEEAELPDLQTSEERGWTTFLRDEKGPYLRHHVIKGTFKDSIQMLNRDSQSECKKPNLKAFKKIVDGCVFVEPDKLHLQLPKGGVEGVFERPLRVADKSGERVTLVRSDTCPNGTKCSFTLRVMGDAITEVQIKEVLEYWGYRGISQFRNAGYGKCVAKIKKQ